jgi:hypothetical protein
VEGSSAPGALREASNDLKDAEMIIVDCPMCLGPVMLNDEDIELVCEDCSIHVEFAPDERLEVARAA